MTHRHCFEALDKSLKDVMRVLDVGNAEVPFGGKVVVFGGDFRQTLPVVSKGSRADVVAVSLCSSYLWSFCKVLRLTKNMRLQVGSSTDNVEELRKFSEWLLEIGDGIAGGENDGEVDLELPADLLIQDVTNPIKTLVDVTYPDLLAQLWNPEYLQQRAILAPTHEIVESVNEYVLSLIEKDERIYLSSDEVCSDDRGTGGGDFHSIEFLNSIKCAGLPNHQLKLKVGAMVMLLRNIDQSRGLCNGTRLIVTDLGERVIRCTVLTGSHKGDRVHIARLTLTPSDTSKFPVRFSRRQFPIAVCFAMTINKSQGQSLSQRASERHALLHFKQDIRVDYCGILDDWEHTLDCCQWRGIRCNNQSGHVIGLNLSGELCLQGTLSISLLNLKHLKYLDLSYNNFLETLPKFIGSLASLEHLNLSGAGFQGVIPQEIGNLSSLTSLDLSSNINLRAESLGWLSRLRLLRELDLSDIDLSTTANAWLSIVNNLPFLQELHLANCKLSLNSPLSLSYINSSTTLVVLSLSHNNLNDTSIFEWLLNLSGLETSLTYLDLSENQMFGNNLQSSQRSMKRLDNLCSLQTLNLEDTNLNYKFSDIIQSFSKCPHKALLSLRLSGNQVWGSIPDNIGAFSSLRELDVDDNQLNGTINESLGKLTMLKILDLSSNNLHGTISQSLWKLTMLETLDLSSNYLNGIITTTHLSNIPKLRYLGLSSNPEIVVNISADWIPPFQLDELRLSSCKIGPYFPRWITTQKNLSWLDISNASISGTIPISFWNSSVCLGIRYLDMSHNMFNGTIPDVSISFDNQPDIRLGYNLLEGAIPTFLRNTVSILYLNNKFSKGLTPFLCPHKQTPLFDLDLSSNFFSEEFPDCWNYFDKLNNLHLENNSLWGKLPISIGELNLGGLHLSNNNLSGELPASLVNCTSLLILDLANNSFTGRIPHDIGHNLGFLVILNLQSNRFVGVLPTSFCDLSNLQFLDLSDNYISGTIPRCIYKLVSMTHTDDESIESLGPYTHGYSSDYESFTWKNNEQTFAGFNSLMLLKGIDISNNKLEGEIPEGISSLVGLKFLNLSRNNLTGPIMSKIGQLTSLESLDISNNHLSGEIPLSLAQISYLSSFDISNNSLTGKIPIGTQLQGFDASSYMGNPGLCGAPLPKCAGDEVPAIAPIGDVKQDTKDDFMLGMYISVVLGIIVGFWGVCGTLVVKRSWRQAYFRFYEDTRDKIYVIWVVKIAKAWRRS
ncbi:receptor-like protein EIX1 [Silene latifolia]|uniref:receptor-like protein EIX1 n=1 Tax=Silene latifolia TaxID=37657 RepID=UPI003D7841E7